MTHLCSLSVDSQFCLSPSVNHLGHQREARSNDWSRVRAANNDRVRSVRNSDLDSNGSERDAASSSNTSFIINLMGMCNKMILPLACLPQECDTCNLDVGGPRPQQPQQQQQQQQQDQQQLLLEEEKHQQQMACRQTNNQFKVPTPDQLRVARGKNGNNASKPVKNSATTSQSSPVIVSQTVAAPPPACPNESEVVAAKSATEGLNREPQQPLLAHFGVPYWSLARFYDFRSVVGNAPTHLVEPMFDKSRHRHMIILDCHRRLKIAIPGFHAQIYRPF